MSFDIRLQSCVTRRAFRKSWFSASAERKAPRTGLRRASLGLGGWGLCPVQILNTGNAAKFLSRLISAEAADLSPPKKILFCASRTKPMVPKLSYVREKVSGCPMSAPEKTEWGEGLSAREREVALLIGRGLSNKEVARELGVKPWNRQNTRPQHIAEAWCTAPLWSHRSLTRRAIVAPDRDTWQFHRRQHGRLRTPTSEF